MQADQADQVQNKQAVVFSQKQLILLLAGVFALAGLTAGSVSLARACQTLSVHEVQLPTLHDTSRGVKFYDRNDHYLCTVRADRDRQPVPLEQISPAMRTALLAAEDHNFFQHHGIDFVGVARAAMANRKAGHVVEGASTITQQLVRNLYLDKNDKSYTRKLKEVFLALSTENHYSKPKILETYLNEVYFGSGVYGIERAANHYFDKHASQLTVPESAFLAGLIRCPSVYADPANEKIALKRQSSVIDKMAEYGYITKAEAAAYKAQRLAFKEGVSPVKFPYYITYAGQLVHQQLGDDMWQQNVNVYTNLDQDAQKTAVQVLNRDFKSLPRGINQGALVTMSVKDGAVLAMVGGVGQYRDNQWNRALFPHTAGSSFKPFVYLTGLIKGVLQPDTLVDDADIADDNPHAKGVYAPKNFDNQYRGWITVRQALIQSRNVCAVRVASQCGINDVIDTAREAGIKSPLDPYPSLALGACAVTPLEMATAYGTLARGGAYMPAQLIRSIKTEDGQVHTLSNAASTNLPAENVNQLVDLMQDVVNCGTGTAARLTGIATAGKTGTADKGKDVWFVGFTPDTVTAVWGGSDQNLAVPGNRVTGGTLMAHIWHDYMTAFYSHGHSYTKQGFARPSKPLLEAVPKYDDATLLTVDASEHIPKPGEGMISDPRQVLANLPTVISNAQNATVNGVGSAFFVQGLAAAKRWQGTASQLLAVATPSGDRSSPPGIGESSKQVNGAGEATSQGAESSTQSSANIPVADQANPSSSAPYILDAANQLKKYQLAPPRPVQTAAAPAVQLSETAGSM